MRRRFASRILLRDEKKRVLLMRFSHTSGPLRGKDFWALPGGEVEAGESFPESARRELFEETGLQVTSLDNEIAVREFAFTLFDGEQVIAEEHFFSLETTHFVPKQDHLSEVERDIVSDFRWWSLQELQTTGDVVYPEDLTSLLQ